MSLLLFGRRLEDSIILYMLWRRRSGGRFWYVGNIYYTRLKVEQNFTILILTKSFWVGWTNIAGWLTLVTTEGFFACQYTIDMRVYSYRSEAHTDFKIAQFISAAAVIASSGSYEIQAWKTYLIFLAILTFTTGANVWGNRILGRWNDAACKSPSTIHV